jgi:hypothetical protein
VAKWNNERIQGGKPMRFMRWLAPALICTSISTALFIGNSFANPPDGVPTANTNIPELVPAPLAKKIALRHAGTEWGKVAPGPSFACADDDGDIVAYAFTFAVGASSFPTSQELSSYLQYGRDVAARGAEALSEADRQKLLKKVADDAQAWETAPSSEGRPPRKSPVGLESPAAVEEYARQFGSRRRIGAGDFGTVVVSARYDRFPIPYYSNYLPTYVYQGDVAQQEAAKALSVDKVALDKVYFIEREGMFFEFSSTNGNVLMHSGTLEVLPVERDLTHRGKKRFPVPEMLERIAAEWNRKKKEVGE